LSVPIIHPWWSGSVPVLVQDAAEPVPSADIKVRDPLSIGPESRAPQAQRPTSCAFGGPGRDALFVTTARTDLDDDALARPLHAGKVFTIEGPGARDFPCLPYRGRTPRSAER
jgi:hypothetical protein